MRLTMKAGKSSAATGVLPSFTARSRVAAKVASSVAMPRINSTRVITGTGFMKCMPMNLARPARRHARCRAPSARRRRCRYGGSRRPAPWPARPGRSLLALPELLVELRQDLEQIANETVIGDLEDRRLLILVDRDDDLGILHPGEMLDGARDADRDIELGRDDLAGLADLEVVRHKAAIARRQRPAHRPADLV